MADRFSRITGFTPLQRLRAAAPATLTVALAAGLILAAPAAIHTARAQSIAIPMRDGIPSLAPLVEKVAPAAVSVSVKSKVDMADNPMLKDPMFRRFFNVPENMPPQERGSLGSGVIIDAKKGYVLTNNHVIDKASEIIVTLSDRRELTAKVIGSDEGTDVALLQVEAKDLTALPMGDSSALKVGDYVIAVGNPFGLGATVTSGIVSALGRSSLNIEGFEDFIQTDAAINPGNSGGPLVNLKGELMGINTLILGPNNGNVGIGFAVPTSMITAVVDQLVQFGKVNRGQIGVAIQDLTPDLAKNLGVSQSEGALVQKIVKGSPADNAGIKAGDVVVAVNEKPVRGSSDLKNRLGMMTLGTTVSITAIRDNRKQNFKVTIGKPATEVVAKVEDRAALEGASFGNAEPGEKPAGVRVTNVERNSPAYQNNLRSKDIIVAVNRKPVATVDDFTTALKDAGRQVALFVRRGDEDVLVVVQ